MGQGQSRPQQKSGDANPAPVQKKKSDLKVPNNWKNDADFRQISPVSDISNPSQFRGRLHQKNAAAAGLPASANRTTNSSRRMSKVCPKQPPPKAGALPPPANFYFPDHHNEEEEDDTPTPVPDILQKRPWMALWKAKCAKAKQQMGQCFQSDDKDDPRGPPLQSRRYSQRREVEQPLQSQKNDPYLQFRPVLKEDHGGMLMMPRSAEKEEAYVDRLSGTASESPISSEKEDKNEQSAPEYAVTLKGRAHSMGTTVMQRIQALQQQSASAAGSTTVTSSFLPNRLSMGTEFSGSGSGGTIKHVESSSTVERPAVKRTLESHEVKPASQRVSATATSKSDKNNEIFRPGHADEHLDKKRASIERSNTSSSSRDERRASIEEQMQRQIDVQTGRVQRLRQQYQDKVQKHRSESVPTRKSEAYSIPAKENQMPAQSKKSAVPPNAAAARKGRSASAPKSRPSIDGSALLHLSGWNNNGGGKKEAQLPALLKVAGWEKEQQLQKPGRSSEGGVAKPAVGRPSISSMPAKLNPAEKQQPSKRRTQSEGGVPKPAIRLPTVSVPSVHTKPMERPVPAKSNPMEKPQPSKKRGQSDGGVPKPAIRLPTVSAPPAYTKQIERPVSAKLYPVEKPQPSKKRSQSDGGIPKPAIRLPTVSAAPVHTKPIEWPVQRHQNESGESEQESPAIKQHLLVEADDVYSRPQKPARKSIGKPLAFMLQQAYFQGNDDDFRTNTAMSPSGTHRATISPTASLGSTSTTNSAPMVSNQALCNAEFLFADNPNVAQLVAQKPARESASHSISTLNSRNRVANFSGQPVTISRTTSNDNTSLTSASSGDYRRVHFSESNEVIFNHDNSKAIERKMSDLTDTTGSSNVIHRKLSDLTDTTATNTRSSMMSIPRIDSIPEDEDEDINTQDPIQSIVESYSDEGNEQVAVFEDDEQEEDEAEEPTPPKSPVMRWSYRNEDGRMQGVTPMINGKTSSTVLHATKSPYLRFMNAKDRFTDAKAKKESPAKKSPAKKKSSPAKRGSLVSARIAAMEGRRVRSEAGGTTKIIMPRKPRRATTGDQVLAPRKASLMSPLFKQQQTISSKQEDLKPATITEKQEAPSPTLIDGQVVGSPPLAFPHSSDASTVVSDDDDSDGVFGAIRHPTMIDQDDGNSSEDSDDDDFDHLLQNNQGSKSHDSSSDFQQSMGSKQFIRGPRFSMSSGGSPYSYATNETHSVATTVVHLPRVDTNSIVSYSDSSMGDTASVPTVLRERDENAVPSAVGRMKSNPQILPFRDTSKVVKPNEQMHRAVAGSNSISQMQRTPMQARTWRALAAAAQEKRNLSERNLNNHNNATRNW